MWIIIWKFEKFVFIFYDFLFEIVKCKFVIFVEISELSMFGIEGKFRV